MLQSEGKWDIIEAKEGEWNRMSKKVGTKKIIVEIKEGMEKMKRDIAKISVDVKKIKTTLSRKAAAKWKLQ